MAFLILCCLDERAECLQKWWISNIHYCIKLLNTLYPDTFISTDASMSGWGACTGDKITGGHGAEHERDNICGLELQVFRFFYRI